MENNAFNPDIPASETQLSASGRSGASFAEALPAYSGAALAWLRALPNEPDSTDIFTLNDDDFAIRCIGSLVENRPFELSVAARHPAGDWFNHLYFESRNREKVFGTKNLGIAYPFVLKQLGGYQLAAPLFVWQLQLEPHAQHPDHWVALRNENHFIAPNYPLFHLIDAVHGTGFSARAQQLAESRQLNARALGDLCDNLRTLLQLGEEGLPLSIQPCPSAGVADFNIAEGRLLWSAVAGIFPTLPRTTVTHAPVVAPNLPADLSWQHALTLLPLDPSQRTALKAVQNNALTVVEGASGTGKTYLISALVINALANGKKCLVVSKSINALRRGQKFLLEKGFGDVSFILRDIAGDHLMLADMLRMAADNKNKTSFDEEVFKTVLNKTLRELTKLDEAWETLHAPFFGEKNFTDTVGQFLRSNRIEGKELLLSQLHPADFEFSKTEYDDVVAAILSSEPLFLRFPTLHHPLSRLKSDIFSRRPADAGLDHTHALVKTLLDQATALHHRYITKTNDYTEALTEHYESHYAELSLLTKRIRDGLEDGTHRFGADFLTPSSATEKLYGVFSDRYKQMIAYKETISAAYEELRRSYGTRKDFDFDFPAGFDNRNLPKIAELAKNFEASLRHWRRRIPATIREDVRRLNAKSIHSGLDFKEQVKELEYAMDIFLEEFNSAGLYEEPMKHEMLTIPKRQEFLEDVIARLEETRFYLRDFPDFYVWQKHWLDLSAPAQKVVRALCKIKPKNWVAAFESWYLYHYLQSEFTPAMQWDNDTLSGYANGFGELKNLLPVQIGAMWQARKNRALRALKSADSNAYKTWFGKNNRSLSADRKADELFQKHIDALTETLPVLLVTPQVALDVVQVSNILFDLVLVDEAHNIPKQECYHLFDMAKNLVVFGDSKQDMTPFAEDDFLEFCKGIEARSYTLEYQHQDCPEEWIDFNRIAFGTPFKRLPSGRAAKDVTVVANVEGRYDEAACTNEAEARQIIDWLNLIEPTPAKTYPVVGIACATVQQRDLIAGQLLKIRQRRLAGHEKIQQLHLNGLGVYQFAELQGQHVDILMLSLTHGLVDAQGNLTRHLHFWNTQLGINQLHVALTRATQKIYIAHSIPPGLHTVLAADKNFLGTCILSHLVSFGEHVQLGEPEAAAAQLEKMKALLNYPSAYYPANVFTEEVEIALQPYFEPGRIRRNATVAGVTVPLVVERSGPDAQTHVLMVDGVLAKSALPSYEWEEKVKQYFARHNIEYIPSLSVQWWKSPRQEARKLAGKIILRDHDTR